MLVGFVTVVLVERISAIHRDNYGVLGVRKMWHALYRDGIDIGREQTARLMRLAGVSGKGKRWSADHDPQIQVAGSAPGLGGARVQSPRSEPVVGGGYYVCANA